MTFDAHAIAKDFPILNRTIRDGKRLVYLDSGATSQKPNVVIDAESNFYRLNNAAVHRGAHQLAEEATDAYEGARDIVANFLNAGVEEIIFTKSATESLNLIAYAMGNQIIANYLFIPFHPLTGELIVFCGALIGAGIGFLWYNTYPAQIFMGDLGSLTLEVFLEL